MKRRFRAALLACAFAATPACATLPQERPLAPAQMSIEMRAYALLSAYAAVLEEAADMSRHPDAPPALKRAIAEAERAATPAAEAVRAAVVAHLHARDAASADALNAALGAAEPPVATLQALVRSGR